MKQIQPVSIWYYGIIYQSTLFSLQSLDDNLSTNAIFLFKLLNNNIAISQGTITMNGEDYQTYSTSTDSNTYAYQWGATQLNLTLV